MVADSSFYFECKGRHLFCFSLSTLKVGSAVYETYSVPQLSIRSVSRNTSRGFCGLGYRERTKFFPLFVCVKTLMSTVRDMNFYLWDSMSGVYFPRFSFIRLRDPPFTQTYSFFMISTRSGWLVSYLST